MYYDVLIIGSGAAGQSLALQLAPYCRIALLSKGALTEGCTAYAQGGIAATINPTDTYESHAQDTNKAGAGLCHANTVKSMVEKSTDTIHWLTAQGVCFSRTSEEGPYHLTQEGGHSKRRVLHVKDATGRAMINVLTDQVNASPNITVFENHTAIDLIKNRQNTCHGAYVLNNLTGQINHIPATFTVLATGGASKVYLYTSNPDGATGDGVAMAWRAGCRISNMEFNQFHPTCLYHPNAKAFLLSEALRGEGAQLKLPDGQPFLSHFHPSKELAPRDVVARAIDYEIKRLGIDHVLLDISHRPKAFIVSHFPHIYERCLAYGFDITKEPVPIVPAAHYTCGGVLVNPSGQSDIPRLYAIGETACTGFHGANRLASNSLLECVVMANLASKSIRDTLEKLKNSPQAPIQTKPLKWRNPVRKARHDAMLIAHSWDEIRRLMWDYVGIVRSNQRLARANQRMTLLKAEISEYYANATITKDLLELRNLSLTADLIIQSALARKESRGLHYNIDYPDLSPTPQNTVLKPTKSNQKKGVLLTLP